jgi:bacillithiol synthase
MIKATVEPACTGQFSQLFLDYLAEKNELREFYSHFPKIENFEKLIAAKQLSQSNREILVEALERQYAGIDLTDASLAQIKSLGKAHTFTVTTGHQLNLFTGPLYFIYKIVSTINLAKQLKSKYPKYHFVPVYWMGAEDHDFDEVNYFKLDGKKYQWHTNQQGAVGEFEIDDSFKEFLKTIPFAHQVFKDAYLNSKTVAEAARKYVHTLFSAEGLVIIDGNDIALKKLLIPVVESDLVDHIPFQKANEKTAALEQLGYKSQVFPREINFFYMDKGVRERIEKVGGQYQVLNTSMVYSESEIKDLIQSHPERFSPNVVLRPLYQEMILPNIAYLGGPAEVAYWFQLKGVFEYYQVPFPAVMPRNFAVILEPLAQKKQEQLGLSDMELFLDFEAWKKEHVAQNAILDISLAEEKQQLTMLMTVASQRAVKVDATLESAFEAAKVRSIKILDHLAGKVRKAEERRLATDLNRMQTLKQMMYPDGNPQERVENMMKFYLADEGFIDKLLANFDPLDFNYLILKLENE